MTGKTICVLSDSCAAPVVSGIQKFRHEFEAYIQGAREPCDGRSVLSTMARRELVKVTIDGVQVRSPKGTTIIEAAKQAGILVPHYCYHPSLPSPAVCRMCLVEVEKAPKLMPACVTTVAEGQVVHVNSEKAKKAREGVLELLLINHPLDCPICDQAGECELQDYVFQEGRAGTRYAEYAKRYSPVEDFGPDVLYVPNRCILCTRCVRFMEDVAEEPVLNVSERGDRAYIGISPEQRLDHPWSGNVVDLCPVGSLISKDFLHKARAWDLDKTASVCPGCTQGCNINIDTRDDVVVRLRPRPNLEVNRHFICDYGRMNYRWMNRGDRIEAPLVRDGGRHVGRRLGHRARPAGPGACAARRDGGDPGLGPRLDRIAGPGAPDAGRLRASPRPSRFRWATRRRLPGSPTSRSARERAPNLGGRRAPGLHGGLGAALSEAESAALVMLLDAELSEPTGAACAGARQRGGAGHRRRPSGSGTPELVLPITNMAEENGTYVNRDRRVQRYSQAKSQPGMARPAWWVAGEVLARARARARPRRPRRPRRSSCWESWPAFAGLTYAGSGVHRPGAEAPRRRAEASGRTGGR